MKSIAVPMAWVPVAQAETTPKLGPRALCSIATTPDAVFEMRAGMRKGETWPPSYGSERHRRIGTKGANKKGNEVPSCYTQKTDNMKKSDKTDKKNTRQTKTQQNRESGEI